MGLLHIEYHGLCTIRARCSIKTGGKSTVNGKLARLNQKGVMLLLTMFFLLIAETIILTTYTYWNRLHEFHRSMQNKVVATSYLDLIKLIFSDPRVCKEGLADKLGTLTFDNVSNEWNEKSLNSIGSRDFGFLIRTNNPMSLFSLVNPDVAKIRIKFIKFKLKNEDRLKNQGWGDGNLSFSFFADKGTSELSFPVRVRLSQQSTNTYSVDACVSKFDKSFFASQCKPSVGVVGFISGFDQGGSLYVYKEKESAVYLNFEIQQWLFFS